MSQTCCNASFRFRSTLNNSKPDALHKANAQLDRHGKSVADEIAAIAASQPDRYVPADDDEDDEDDVTKRKDDTMTDARTAVRAINKRGESDLSEGELCKLIADEAPIGTPGVRRAIAIAKSSGIGLERDVEKNMRR